MYGNYEYRSTTPPLGGWGAGNFRTYLLRL